MAGFDGLYKLDARAIVYQFTEIRHLKNDVLMKWNHRCPHPGCAHVLTFLACGISSTRSTPRTGACRNVCSGDAPENLNEIGHVQRSACICDMAFCVFCENGLSKLDV